MATVTNLAAVHRSGQTFLTFTEIAGGGVTYSVYRETSQITSLSGLTPVATLDQDSGKNLYTNAGHVISDMGSPLSAVTGLLVWTTSANGTYFYAVTNSTDSALSAGNNSMTSGISETHQDVPGAVWVGYTPDNGSHKHYLYFAWFDYSKWNHAVWGYYGHWFNVSVPLPIWGMTAPYPLIVYLHAAGNNGSHEPIQWDTTAIGIVLTVRDRYFQALTDPYVGGPVGMAKHCGFVHSVNGLFISQAEQRYTNYVKLILEDPTFDIDQNRVYVTGASLGSGAMHLASHYPDLFAGCATSIGFIDDAAFEANPDAGTLKVDDASGPTLANYQSIAVQAGLRALPPTVHTFNKDDGTISPANYPAALQTMETNKQPYASKWQNGNHVQFWLAGARDYKRFKKNEAYPCFAGASNSDAFADQEGERNVQLDWHSALHTITGGSAITDTDQAFGVSLISLDVPCTANVTIRNQQTFTAQPGAAVTWSDGTGSGSANVNADGSITVPGVTIGTSATRLALARAPVSVGARTSLRRVGI